MCFKPFIYCSHVVSFCIKMCYAFMLFLNNLWDSRKIKVPVVVLYTHNTHLQYCCTDSCGSLHCTAEYWMLENFPAMDKQTRVWQHGNKIVMHHIMWCVVACKTWCLKICMGHCMCESSRSNQFINDLFNHAVSCWSYIMLNDKAFGK